MLDAVLAPGAAESFPDMVDAYMREHGGVDQMAREAREVLRRLEDSDDPVNLRKAADIRFTALPALASRLKSLDQDREAVLANLFRDMTPDQLAAAVSHLADQYGPEEAQGKIPGESAAT